MLPVVMLLETMGHLEGFGSILLLNECGGAFLRMRCTDWCADRMQELLAAQAAAAGAPAEVPGGDGACAACEEKATELRDLEAAKRAAEEGKQKVEVQCQDLEERARKLESERMRADEAAERLEEALAGYQDQVADLQTRVHKLENEQETWQASHATSAAAAADEKQELSAKVAELQRALETCQDELRESRNERETAVAKLESDIERVREESQEHEAKTKEKAKSIIEVRVASPCSDPAFSAGPWPSCVRNTRPKLRVMHACCGRCVARAFFRQQHWCCQWPSLGLDRSCGRSCLVAPLRVPTLVDSLAGCESKDQEHGRRSKGRAEGGRPFETAAARSFRCSGCALECGRG